MYTAGCSAKYSFKGYASRRHWRNKFMTMHALDAIFAMLKSIVVVWHSLKTVGYLFAAWLAIYKLYEMYIAGFIFMMSLFCFKLFEIRHFQSHLIFLMLCWKHWHCLATAKTRFVVMRICQKLLPSFNNITAIVHIFSLSWTVDFASKVNKLTQHSSTCISSGAVAIQNQRRMPMMLAGAQNI